MTHYDFVDIGTSDFDTSSGMGRVLLVEPLSYYLDNIPEAEGTTKLNFAISDKAGKESIFYVPEFMMQAHKLPNWVRGCNSLGGLHPNVTQLEEQYGKKFAIEEEVDVITFQDLVSGQDISSIGTLKIDTEGHDHIILKSVIDSIPELKIDSIVVEYKKDFGNLDQMNDRITSLRELGYKVTRRWGDNVKLEKAQPKKKSTRTRLVALTYNEWAFGSLHYELAKSLHNYDIDLSLLPWQIGYSREEMQELASGTDLFMTTPDAVPVLVNDYGVEHEQILVVAHSIVDFTKFQSIYDLKELSLFRGLGVISSFLKDQVQELEPSLNPTVVPLGVNCSKFWQEIPETLTTLGYAGKFERNDYGSEDWKRGYLAERIAQRTGLPLKIAERYHHSYVTMPGFYNSVDCVIVTSNEKEAGGLPALEAAASGRLVLSTPVGHIRERGLEECADILPIEEEAFVDTAVELINRYRSDSELFRSRCTELQLNAQKSNWDSLASIWAEFIL